MVKACKLVGRSRATHHRQANPQPRMHGPWPKAQHPAELSAAERAQILTVLKPAGLREPFTNPGPGLLT
ncbi:hypothetical protein [Arthrobacter sp. A5]|uniref:hypothetical protein n=1 Tax=Arthrobacter sp. A5 TaxID=576926 RepID=UPI003DA7B7CA